MQLVRHAGLDVHSVAVRALLAPLYLLCRSSFAITNLYRLYVLSVCSNVCVQVVEEDQTIADLHAASERFEPKSELSFKYLQVRAVVCCAALLWMRVCGNINACRMLAVK